MPQAQSGIVLWNTYIEDTYKIVRRLPEPNVPGDSGRSVVLIEPRQHPHLDYVLRNVLHFLGGDWGLEIFAGPANRRYIEELTASWGDVWIHPIDARNLSTIAYNQLKKNPETWGRVRAEHTLWIEPDCLLCRPGIDDYLHYDYIGAPWREELSVSPSCRVGNGGLSLRRKSVMLEIAQRCNRDHKMILSEDVFFCVNMHLRNSENPGVHRIPDAKVAASFSVESVFHESPLGLHKIWKYLPAHRVTQLLSAIEY